VVADSRAPRNGVFIDVIGHYNPLTNPETIVIDEEKASVWLKQGAQPTDIAARLLAKAHIIVEPEAKKEKSKTSVAAKPKASKKKAKTGVTEKPEASITEEPKTSEEPTKKSKPTKEKT